MSKRTIDDKFVDTIARKKPSRSTYLRLSCPYYEFKHITQGKVVADLSFTVRMCKGSDIDTIYLSHVHIPITEKVGALMHTIENAVADLNVISELSDTAPDDIVKPEDMVHPNFKDMIKFVVGKDKKMMVVDKMNRPIPCLPMIHRSLHGMIDFLIVIDSMMDVSEKPLTDGMDRNMLDRMEPCITMLGHEKLLAIAEMAEFFDINIGDTGPRALCIKLLGRCMEIYSKPSMEDISKKFGFLKRIDKCIV